LLGSHHLAVARRIVHVAELPLSGSGKTDYMKLNSLNFNHEKRFQSD